MSPFSGGDGNRIANASARAGEKNLFHGLEIVFASRDALRIALILILILTVAAMQECPTQEFRDSPGCLEYFSGGTMSILSRCGR